MSSYNYVIEIAGAAVGFARQAQGLEGNPGPPNSGTSSLGTRAPIEVAGAGARFGGQYYVNKTTHNMGGSQWGTPGRQLTAAQAKVILLGVVQADSRGAAELALWWGQRSSPESGRRPVSIVQCDASGRELRRYSMDGWLVAWQGPVPVPGLPDPPPESARVEVAAANLRLGR
jgi:hypothetical protein